MSQRILGTLKGEKAFCMESIGPQEYGQHSRLREEAWTNAKRSRSPEQIQNRIKSIEYTRKTAWSQLWTTEGLIFTHGVTARQCCKSIVSNSVFKRTADMQWVRQLSLKPPLQRSCLAKSTYLSILAAGMQFCYCQAGDGIHGRLNVSDGSSQNARHQHTGRLI